MPEENDDKGDKVDNLQIRDDIGVEENLKCGYLSCTPKWLQVANVPKGLLSCLCWYAFVQSFVVNGVNSVNAATLERRFELTSSRVAWISSAYDLSAGICAVFFGYFGMFLHNGRTIAFGAIALAAGSFTMTLPHWLAGEYVLGQAPTGLCSVTTNATSDCNGSTSLSMYFYVFVAGQILHGVGGAAVYTLGIPYMDENIKIKNTPVYIGFMLAFSALGPAVGFVTGGYFLTIYVDFTRVDKNEISIDEADPRWVGAWWVAILCSGIASVTVAFLIGMFPRELPVAKVNRKERRSQAYKRSGDDSKSRQKNQRSFQQILYSMKLFFTNPTWIFLTLGGIFEGAMINAIVTFLPKLIQLQFNLSASTAGMWAGLLAVAGATTGQLFGGLIPRWLQLRIRGMIIQCIICSLIAIGLSFAFLLKCDVLNIAGINVPYQNTSYTLAESDLIHTCNSHCPCATNSYDPVCGVDDTVYFSPCYAGCSDVQESSPEMVYYNCSCLLTNNTEGNGWSTATKGLCSQNCNVLPYFLLCIFLLAFVTFASSTSGQAASLRCVPDKQRSFSVGIQAVIIRLLGNVPGPLALGAIFDNSCLIWQDKCDSQASCWIYDRQALAFGLCLSCVVVKAVSSLCFSLSLCLYKPPPETEPPITMDIDSKATSQRGKVKERIGHRESEPGTLSKRVQTVESLEQIRTEDLEQKFESDMIATYL